MVQADVLEAIDSESLVVYAVWEPILRTDDERAARKATSLLSDRRVRHFWVSTRDVGEEFSSAIDLSSGPAWDVYLLYPPGVTWEAEGPPRPASFMHQMGGRLPEARRLDGPKLAEATLEAIASKPH